MSNLYLDQIKKIEVYKKRIVDQYLQEGRIIDKLQLQKKIDEIDTKVAVFKQGFIENGETLDLEKFNEQKQDIYEDLKILYKIIFELGQNKLSKVEARIKSELNELTFLANKYKYKNALETMSIYGNTIFYQSSGFDQSYINGQVEINLGEIAIPSGSYVTCLLNSEEVDPKNVYFDFNGQRISDYMFNKNHLRIPGNYSLESYDFKVEEANSTVFPINVENIQLNKKNQYNLFAGENLLRIDYPNIGGYEYVEKNPNQPFVADQDCVISFFVYGSSQISITTNSKYEYKNYDESIIDTPKYRQKILIKARVGFTFDMITDGRVFSSMSACEISEDNLYSTKQYNNISDFMLEEIKYGEDVRIPNIKVIIKNAQSEFFDINYIAIKQTQISEVDGEIL
jgi:hypothetical protein